MIYVIIGRIDKSKQVAKIGYSKHPEKRIKEIAKNVKAFIVPEINAGQLVLEVERCAYGQAPAYHVPHYGGGVHNPQAIFDKIKEAVK